MKFDIGLLVRYHQKRENAYKAYNLVQKAILESNEFPSAIPSLAAARDMLEQEIEKYERPFKGLNGDARNTLCRFLIDKINARDIDQVIDYLNAIVNDEKGDTSLESLDG